MKKIPLFNKTVYNHMTFQDKINILKANFNIKDLKILLDELHTNSVKLVSDKIFDDIAKIIDYSNKSLWDDLIELSRLNPFFLNQLGTKIKYFNEKQQTNFLKKMTLVDKKITNSMYSSIVYVLKLKDITVEDENNCFIVFEKNFSDSLDSNSELFIKRKFKNHHNISRIYPYLKNIYLIKNLAIHPQISIEGKQDLIEKLRIMIANQSASKEDKERMFRIIKTIHKSLGTSPAEVLTKLLS